METKTLKPYFVVIGLMIATSLALALTVDVRTTDEAGIRMFLPDRVGAWEGQEMRFCLNPACQKEFLLGDLEDPEVCPACGGPLSTMSLGEKDLLPGDTEILKKRYVSPDGEVLFVSIVLSGKERASIHRPQVCLVGQGSEIVDSSVVHVPLEGRKPLDVMVLDLLRRRPGPEGQPITAATYYAYWFVGKGRETPSHVQRMIWMATDRIFRNVSHRWAYIAVGGARTEGSEQHHDKIRAFVRELYPEMVLD